MSERIENVFPELRSQRYEITSAESDVYNCIAWALYDTRQWWWPTPRYGCYWPPGVSRENTLPVLIRIFEIHGYSACDSPEPERGYEKIALYEHPQTGVEHVARQLQDGNWTSKLGEWEDITHQTPHVLECDDYGKVVQIMKRQRKDWT